jgi:uncharacterized protein
MHKFSTLSGRQLWYNVADNRISLWSPDKEQEVYPIVRFNAPATIEDNRITMFTIEMTQQCNLRCSYCCYSGYYRDRRTHNEKEISYETLQYVVEFIKAHADKNVPEITVCFYGGEALLARKKTEWLASELKTEFNDRIQFSLSTNGLALTADVIDWICTFDKFLVNVTIDGNKVMHDVHRKTISGRGSYDRIIGNLKLFESKYPKVYRDRVRFLSTVYSWNDVKRLAEVWDSEPVLNGHYPIHISHIIPNLSDQSRLYDTWEIKDNFYKETFKAYTTGQNEILSGCFQKLIDIIDNRNYLKLPSELKIQTCFQGLFSCFVNVDGDLYACEKFCGESKVGNVKNGFKPELMVPLLNRFTNRKNKLCSSCWAQRFCRMCMTSLNYTDGEIMSMCDMERDTIDLALKYYCELKDWERNKHKK